MGEIIVTIAMVLAFIVLIFALFLNFAAPTPTTLPTTQHRVAMPPVKEPKPEVETYWTVQAEKERERAKEEAWAKREEEQILSDFEEQALKLMDDVIFSRKLDDEIDRTR